MKSPRAVGTGNSGMWGKLPKDPYGRKGLGTGAPGTPLPPTELQTPCNFRLSLERGCSCRPAVLSCRSLGPPDSEQPSRPLAALHQDGPYSPKHWKSPSTPCQLKLHLVCLPRKLHLHSPQPSQTSSAGTTPMVSTIQNRGGLGKTVIFAYTGC